MRSKTAFRTLCTFTLGLVFLTSCSEGKKDPPARDYVEPLLKEEADTMKREGESDVNPSLGVTITWMVQSVDVREQLENEAEPWAGTIRFVIESETPELDGTVTERFERTYDYVWELEYERWAMR